VHAGIEKVEPLFRDMFSPAWAAAAPFETVMGERSVLTGMMPQSDKSVSRETFWYD